MTVVDADALGKSFGRVRVLRDLTLRLDGGDTVALFGPNGAGKSTLLRICATLYAPTAGTLALFGWSNGSRSRARCFTIPSSCCSTSRGARSTPRARTS